MRKPEELVISTEVLMRFMPRRSFSFSRKTAKPDCLPASSRRIRKRFSVLPWPIRRKPSLMNDETHYKELRNAQTDQARLRDRLATADVRLSVLLAAPGGGGGLPADTGGAGVDHGEARAELDSAHAQRIIAIAGDGDQGLIALAACQEYLRGLQASKE